MPIRNLNKQLREFRLGDHICLVYQEFADQTRVVVPYIQQGLARGECCIYVVDDRIGVKVLQALTQAGVEVEAQSQRGALVLLDKYKIHIQSGKFERRDVMERLRQICMGKIKAGFGGVRITIEMTWALGPEAGLTQLMEHEETLDRFFPGMQAICLCQYNANLFPVAVIDKVRRIHSAIIVHHKLTRSTGITSYLEHSTG